MHLKGIGTTKTPLWKLSQICAFSPQQPELFGTGAVFRFPLRTARRLNYLVLMLDTPRILSLRSVPTHVVDMLIVAVDTKIVGKTSETWEKNTKRGKNNFSRKLHRPGITPHQ